MYGPHTNERLVGEAIAGRRDEVVLATKFGIVRDPEDPTARGVNGRPEYVRAVLRRVAAAPRRRPHRPLLPAPRRSRRADRGDGRGDGRAGRRRQGALPRAVRGRRRDDPPRARRPPDHRAADRVLAVEPRPRGRDPADAARAGHRLRRLQPARPRLPHRRDHARSTTSAEDDFRRTSPRFQGDNFARNLELVERVDEIAAEQGLHARRSSRWPGCIAQGDDVVPIPGTKRRSYLEENVARRRVELAAERPGRARRGSRPPAPPPATATRTCRRSGAERPTAPPRAHRGHGKTASGLAARRALYKRYASRDLERRDQLRAGQRADQAVQRHVAEDGALPPAHAQRRRAHTAEARRPDDGEEVPFEDIVKGYEIDARPLRDRSSPEELDALDPKATKTIDIEEFVDLAEIDPVYYDNAYYLAPATGGAKPYRCC